LTSLGYREISAYLRGDMDLPAAIERIQIETHRFVRHQYSWFRRMETVQWYDGARPYTEAIASRIAAFLTEFW
jgi:tRNA dimethylallyltransferase